MQHIAIALEEDQSFESLTLLSNQRSKEPTMRKILAFSIICGGLGLPFGTAVAEQGYLGGHITNTSFVGDAIYIILDTGVPGNCAGTPYGWMVVRGRDKAMQALVLSLRASGDFPITPVTVYTDGIGSSGYCEINQLDPVD